MNDHGRFGAFRAVVALELALRAEGPLIVRGPDAFVPDAPDTAFIRMPTPHGDAPFLPGSSLKGVLRTGAEALLRGLGEQVCDPTKRDEPGGCGQCRACRTFGSSKLGAAVALVGDGMPWPPEADDAARAEALAAVERSRSVRSGVAIDRQRGSVAVGPFDMEVLSDVTFYPSIMLRNPQPCQLHLVAAALHLLDSGVLRVGSGTTKGLGRVCVQARKASVRCLDAETGRNLLGALPADLEEKGIFKVLHCQDPQTALSSWAAQLASSLRRRA